MGNWDLTFVMLMALPAALVAALEAMVATVASVSTIKLGMLDPIHSQPCEAQSSVMHALGEQLRGPGPWPGFSR
jgi:hypothetical protein